MQITKRLTKGSPLTNKEIDDNFDYLDTNKANKDLSNVSTLPDTVKELLRGPKGATWQSGTGAPSDTLGVDGDYYLETVSGDVYRKSSGAYSINCNIKGPSGGGSGKNKLINGGFIINQRVYVSGTALSAGTYAHDRWKAGASGCTYTFTQGVEGVPIQIAITAGSLLQIIEGCNIQESGTYTLSWQGTAQARVNGGSYSASPLTVAASSAMNIAIEFGVGTVLKPQLEAGSSATVFEHLDYPIVRFLCERYAKAIGTFIGSGGGNGTTIICYVALGTPLRASPTISCRSTVEVTYNALNKTQSAFSASTSPFKRSGFMLYLGGFTGIVAGGLYTSYINSDNDAIILDAEL